MRLERLINDLLDLSRLQSVKTAIDKEKLPLPAVAVSVVHMLEQQAQQKEIHLLANTQETPAIRTNVDRITQLLLILLDNAKNIHRPAGR